MDWDLAANTSRVTKGVIRRRRPIIEMMDNERAPGA
jgi:hypothetical protein